VRKLAGYPALVVGVVGVVMSLYHVYARLTPAAPDSRVLRVSTLAFSRVLAFLLFPARTGRTPADVVYKITKAVVEGREDFARVTSAMKGVTAQDMAQSFGMPYHPGAEKYFREAGLLK
jgi:TRAP-type uncharacterized transport system fused permease subunit